MSGVEEAVEEEAPAEVVEEVPKEVVKVVEKIKVVERVVVPEEIRIVFVPTDTLKNLLREKYGREVESISKADYEELWKVVFKEVPPEAEKEVSEAEGVA